MSSRITAPRTLAVPSGSCLVAIVEGLNWFAPDGPAMRRTHLVAKSIEDFAVRDATDGSFIWGLRDGDAAEPRYQASRGTYVEGHGRLCVRGPIDQAREGRAAIDLEGFLEWINPEAGAVIVDGYASGRSVDFGEFVVKVHPDHGFVLAAVVPSVQAEPVVQVLEARIVTFDPPWLDPASMWPLPGQPTA